MTETTKNQLVQGVFIFGFIGLVFMSSIWSNRFMFYVPLVFYLIVMIGWAVKFVMKERADARSEGFSAPRKKGLWLPAPEAGAKLASLEQELQPGVPHYSTGGDHGDPDVPT